MANKNQKTLRVAVARACKKGLDSVAHYHPQYVHKDSTPHFVKQNIPTAVRNKNGVNSANPHRNMGQFVLVNQNDDGSKYSMTRHEPLDSSKPVKYANHAYLKGSYRQPARIAS